MTLRTASIGGHGGYLIGQAFDSSGTAGTRLRPSFELPIAVPVVAIAIHPASEVRAVRVQDVGSSGPWVDVYEGSIVWLRADKLLRVSRAPGGWTDGQLVLWLCETDADALGIAADVHARRQVRAYIESYNNSVSKDVWLDPGALTKPIPTISGKCAGADVTVSILAGWRARDGVNLDDTETLSSYTLTAAAPRSTIAAITAIRAADVYIARLSAGTGAQPISLAFALDQGS